MRAEESDRYFREVGGRLSGTAPLAVAFLVAVLVLGLLAFRLVGHLERRAEDRAGKEEKPAS